MIQARGSAGEGRISTGAEDRAAATHTVSALYSSSPRQGGYHPARQTYPVYDPNEDRRRCPSCGDRSGWRRVLAIGGGWLHCGPTDADLHHGDLNHTCNALCTLSATA